MPILRDHKFLTPYVLYDAPVDEKTEKIREMFDVDPETGYPRHYNWRSLAKLGREYSVEDAYEKLLPFKEEQLYSTYVTSAVFALGISYGLQRFWNFHKGRPAFAKPVLFFTSLLWFGGSAAYMCYKTPFKQSRETAMYIDYVRSHPDRFEPKKRYKHREVLLWNKMVRS